MSTKHLITSKNAIFVLILVCYLHVQTLGAGVVLPSVTQLVFADQRLAVVYPVIQLFKNLITSDPLKVTATWTGSDVCSYRGFFCESPPDNKSAMALASIDFNGFQLSAPTLDGFLDQLQDIALFHANSNNFGGTISPNVAKLPYLYELDISNNQFTGPFPSAVLGMELLTFLDIRFNSFTGSVPAELFSKELDVLFLNDNFFTTRLPDNIATTHISYLTLANNKFFGPIPRSIAKIFGGSTEVLLQNNLLTGCLPFEIGLLNEVVNLDIGNNHLTGRLPFSLGCLQNLELLNLAGNQFFGSVPEMLCTLGNLGNLSLSDNYFSHIGPICFSLIQSGVLDLKKNCILGLPFQRSIAECAVFFSLPRYCPHMPSYMHIPCWLPQFKTLAPSPT